jgi:hypothetical protein
MTRLAGNGAALLTMRRGGLRPAGVVLVSLIGGLRFDNFTLYARPRQADDWSPLADLDVEVFANMRVPFADVLATLAGIARAVPRSLALSFIEGPGVDCGCSAYLLESLRPCVGRPLFNWMPIGCAPSHRAASARLAKRLWREVGGALPDPYGQMLDRLPPLLEQEARCGATYP